jgi:hypothetical protein
MAEGFLGRWSQRKEAVRKGKELAPEPEKEAPGVPPPQASAGGGESLASSPPAHPPDPAPTLEDAQALTKDSDFTRFVRPDVAPEVKNAAFRKLFSDPHFNVMDGLDTYIDDYGKPDPIPPEMLRQLASAKFLKLFEEKEEKPQPGEDAERPGPQAVAQSDARSNVPSQPPGPEPAASSPDDADPDLRLQQDHAPGREVPGAGSS